MRKTALNVSGLIFLVVGLLHSWRYLMKVPVNFGETSIPVGLSFAGAVACFFLALWMFSSARKS